MKPFCANPLCICHVEVTDDVRAITFEAKPPVTFKRVVIQQTGKPHLTVCSTCARILQLIHES